MKINKAKLPESFFMSLEENSLCVGINRPEHIRIAIRELIRNELLFSETLEKEPQQNNIIRFFDYCINCERKLHNISERNHFFHKTIEIFNLKFCCSCFEQFKDKTLYEFPEDLIDKIRKKIKTFKKNLSSSYEEYG